MHFHFSKMHGLGNDFMVVDCITQNVFFSQDLIRRLADRHTGVGFDQLLVVEAPYDPETDFVPMGPEHVMAAPRHHCHLLLRAFGGRASKSSGGSWEADESPWKPATQCHENNTKHMSII